MSELSVSELFSLSEAAEVLCRRHYSIWYHATHNLKPIRLGSSLYLTSAQLRSLARHRLKLKKGESRRVLLERIDLAVREKKKQVNRTVQSE